MGSNGFVFKENGFVLISGCGLLVLSCAWSGPSSASRVTNDFRGIRGREPQGVAMHVVFIEPRFPGNQREFVRAADLNPKLVDALKGHDFIFISASNKTNISELKEKILAAFQVKTVKSGDVVVTNLRHYQHLLLTHEALDRVLHGMANQVTGDFLAMDIRQSLHYLGEITGTITTDDLLANIFSKFCIGK
jgi:hypothetical protein